MCPGERRTASATEDLAPNRWRRAEHSPASSAHLVVTAVRPQADGEHRARLNRWESEDGETRTKVELVADEIGASLRFATVDIHKVQRLSADNEVTGEANPT